MPISLVCEHCGTSFDVPPIRVKRGARYCSKACYNAAIHTTDEERRDYQRNYQREWSKRSPERRKEIQQKYSDTHKTVRQQRTDAWRKRNAHLMTEYNRKWSEATKPARRKWLHTNRARHAGYIAKRRSIMRTLPATLTIEEWEGILRTYNNSCAYCGASDVPLQKEHKLPASRGGGYTAENIVPACLPCNVRKHTKTDKEFREYLQTLHTRMTPNP